MTDAITSHRESIDLIIMTLFEAASRVEDDDAEARIAQTCSDCVMDEVDDIERYARSEGERGHEFIDYECPECGAYRNLVVSYIDEEVVECSSCGYQRPRGDQ